MIKISLFSPKALLIEEAGKENVYVTFCPKVIAIATVKRDAIGVNFGNSAFNHTGQNSAWSTVSSVFIRGKLKFHRIVDLETGHGFSGATASLYINDLLYKNGNTDNFEDFVRMNGHTNVSLGTSFVRPNGNTMLLFEDIVVFAPVTETVQRHPILLEGELRGI